MNKLFSISLFWLLSTCWLFFSRPVDQLDICHGSGVAWTEATLQNSSIATWTSLIPRPNLIKELGYGIAASQAIKRQTPVCNAILLGKRYERLRKASELFSLWQCSPDELVLKEGHCHILEHALLMSTSATEFTAAVTMTHGK